MQPPSRWPRIRAALIAIAIGLNLLMALPQPAPLDKRYLNTPDARDEIQAWHELTTRVGLDWTRQEIKELAITWSNRWRSVRTAVIQKPTRPLQRYLGIHQGWALFARPDTWPSLLVIEMRAGKGPWTEVYRALDPEKDAQRARIRFRRVRGVLDGAVRRHANYDNLCRQIAGHLFDDFPDMDTARFRMMQTHIGRPDEGVEPEVRKLHALVVTREEL